MKNRKINFIKLGIFLFGISILLWNCEKEDSLSHTEQVVVPEYSVSRIGIPKIQENIALIKNLDALLQQENKLHSKNVYSSEYDFTVNTDFAKYIENRDGTYHSYTFPVSREIDNGLLENLLVTLQNDGSYKILLISYDVTEDQKNELLIGNVIDLKGKVTFTKINNNLLNLFSRTETISCFEIYFSYCSEGNHPNGMINGVPCPAQSISSRRLCGFSGSPTNSGNESGNDSDNENNDNHNNAGGSGGPASNNDNDNNDEDEEQIITVPVVPKEFIDDDPCESLKDDSQNSDFLDKMADLNTKSTTLNKEAGYIQKQNSTNTGSDYDYHEEDVIKKEIIWTIPAGTTITGMYHTHDDIQDHLPVFSTDDLYALFALFGPVFDINGNVTFNNPHNIDENNFSYVLITAHGTKLALTFNKDGVEKLRQLGEKYFGDWNINTSGIPQIPGITPETDRKKFENKYEEFVNKKFSIEKQKKMFAKFLKKANIGVSLFQATDDSFTKWEKINKSGNPTPCN